MAQTLSDILTRARQVDELAAEVAGASHEQSQGIDQVTQAVGQRDRVFWLDALAPDLYHHKKTRL